MSATSAANTARFGARYALCQRMIWATLEATNAHFATAHLRISPKSIIFTA